MSSSHPASNTTLRSVEIDILVIDDRATDAELTLLALNGLHPRPRALWLNDSRQAMDYLMCRGQYSHRSPALPALVLTDIHMPLVSGRELLALIRSEPRLEALRVIMLSGNADPDEVRESYRLGATGFVEKSLAYETFTVQLIQAVMKNVSTIRVADPSQIGTQ